MADRKVGIIVGPDEQRAIDILGQGNVHLASEAAIAWDTGLAEHPIVPFSDELLRQCAKENHEEDLGEDGWGWELIYLMGFLKNVEPGYRLICFGKSREKIPQNCESLTREESLEAAITFYLIEKNNEQLTDIIQVWMQEFVIARQPDLIAP